MGWILCNDSENKDENADYGEMTRKQPKEFIGNDEKSYLKDDLGTKRLKIINEVEVMKKEIMKNIFHCLQLHVLIIKTRYMAH